jgi:transcriptional antiterminator RfaH
MSNTDTDNYTWYALYTKSRAEKKVESFLKEQGVDAYVPVQKVLRCWSDRKKIIEVPLVRSYVFVHLSQYNKNKVNYIPGMARIVSFDGQAIPVTKEEIRWLRLLEGSNSESVEPKIFFKKGEQVEIIAGALKGLQGELVEFRGKKKVIITITPVNQQVMVEIAGHFLSKVSKTQKVA